MYDCYNRNKWCVTDTETETVVNNDINVSELSVITNVTNDNIDGIDNDNDDNIEEDLKIFE